MKILYYHGSYPFCYYYRGYLPGVYSKQMVVSEFVKGLAPNTEKLVEQAKNADVVVFQRPLEDRAYDLAVLLKSQGKKIIFENDDTYKGIPLERLDNEKQKQIARDQSIKLIKFMELADGCIASTEKLAEEYREHNKNTVTLKNCIDPLDEMKCKSNTTGKFRIGFIGSVTTNDDYVHIKDQIKKLDERGDVTIVIMGVKYPDNSFIPLMGDDHAFWGSIKNIEWHPYCPITEYIYNLSKLALDVAIIPRLEHYFNECKSNLKFLEMSLLRIPVIAQGFKTLDSPYDADKDYLTMVTNNETWYQTIVDCKDNYDRYKLLANKAHDYVLEHYNIKNYALEWDKQIHLLCKFQKNT